MPYQTIMMDPPWPEDGGGGRGAQNHYPTIKTKEGILKVIEDSGVFRPHLNAYLWMWVTNNYLPWGLYLMANLGFNYKTMATWPKESSGTGYYMAGQTEHMLFGVRGTLMPKKKCTLKTLMNVKDDPSKYSGQHSVKPVEGHEYAETIGYGPMLEMFARRPRTGWDCWGRDMRDSENNVVPAGKVLRCHRDGDVGVFDPY